MISIELRQAAHEYAKPYGGNLDIVKAFIAGCEFQSSNMATDEPAEGLVFGDTASENPPSFQDFWLAYDYKVAKLQTRKMWERLSLAQKVDVMEHLPAYVASTTKNNERGKKARMHPSTFINPANERWKDEINTPMNYATNQQLTFAEQSLNGLQNLVADRERSLRKP